MVADLALDRCSNDWNRIKGSQRPMTRDIHQTILHHAINRRSPLSVPSQLMLRSPSQ
jgi:hypothetical protein